MTNSNILNTFLKIVQIDSPTGYEQQMSKEIKILLDNIGLNSEIDRHGNVIAFLSGNKNFSPYMVNAHLDTVEPGRGIKPKIENLWIKSSGNTILGADNKVAVAAILEAIRLLVLEDPQKRHSLEIVFTTSEESGNLGAIGLDYSKIKSRFGYSFDVSSMKLGDIMISSPFYNRIEIEIEIIGKSGHAKNPEKGINVLPIFAKAINKLKLGRVSENTLVNIGIVKIGEAVNSIPGNASIVGEVRSTIKKELEETTSEIIKIFTDSVKGSGVKLESKIVRENAGFKYDKDDKFVKRTVRIGESFGLNPKLIDSFGCADANIFAEHGIKMLSLADGSMGAHTVDEKIKINDLERLVDLICVLVKEEYDKYK
ncbi:tripeptidase T [soil metagenome]